MADDAFLKSQKRMGGMQEASTKVSVRGEADDIVQRILVAANLATTPDTSKFGETGIARFTGRKLGDNTAVLFSIEVGDPGSLESGTTGKVRVNCDNAVLSSTFLGLMRKAAES